MKFVSVFGAAALAVAPGVAAAQESDVELAKKLANPVSDLVSLPFQFNYDCCYGPSDGERVTLNIQPVVPLHLSEDWNLIIRTIVPVISQSETAPGLGDQMGFGDTLQTFFFSPKTEGFVLGFGPAISYPTGTDGFSAQQWAAGPAGLVLKQQGHMTYGLLATQLWAVDTTKPQEVNTTLLQPFFNYTFPNTTGVVVNFESTYDWTREQWTVPMNVGVTHMYKFGANQKVQAGVFGRYYFDSPDGGPDWGLRFVLTYLIPS
ncbi:transporter [Phenylobacterium sp. LjRoot164]|uniref:hypothetical protein n=1 Tax=unclassified Phenylobacterium TaxID=2640670 RepID=UPI003ECC6913